MPTTLTATRLSAFSRSVPVTEAVPPRYVACIEGRAPLRADRSICVGPTGRPGWGPLHACNGHAGHAPR
jgi:hypothetical protein